MTAPPNCLAPGNEHDGGESISFCARCYVAGKRTRAEEEVIRAAVVWCEEHRSANYGDDCAAVPGSRELYAAVDMLLAGDPSWSKP